MAGSSWSIPIPPTVAEPTLPARSVTVRVTDWPAPLPVRVTSSAQVVAGIPDNASEQLKWTVTGPVYQPPAPGVPRTIEPVITGRVRSTLTSTESVPTLPATSLAWPVTN